MHSVKRSGKLATATASFLWQKCLEFCDKKLFTILNAYVYALFSYSFSSINQMAAGSVMDFFFFHLTYFVQLS